MAEEFEQSSPTVEELRNELAKLVTAEPLDIIRVSELAAQLSRADPSNVRFSVDAGVIGRLGRELVARQETAVAELIKNSYDADAVKVIVRFDDTETEGGTIAVLDDGTGMTRQELVDGFMRLASVTKLRSPLSPRFRRRRAGRKGIGRFAAQRLGSTLQITTQTAEATVALRVILNWSDFAPGLDLSSITTRILEVPKEQEHGTELRIKGALDAWSIAAIRRVYRYVADLLQPFPLGKQEPAERVDRDPGFKVSMLRSVAGVEETIADEHVEILSQALAIIEGHIDEQGVGEWTLASAKLGIKKEVHRIGATVPNPREPFSALRNVHFRAYYFIHGVMVPPLASNTIRRIASERGGIRLYRNGFRVPPYGDQGDDWLGLDEAYRRRDIVAPIANNNFFGFVEVNDREGVSFEETSSREHVIENEAFKQLRDFVFRSIAAAVLVVAEVRMRKGTAGQRDWDSIVETPVRRLRDIVRTFDAISRLEELTFINPSDPRFGEQGLHDVLRRATDEFDRTVSQQEQVNRELIEELAMLRVLASLGIVVAEFTHEIQQTVGAAFLGSRELLRHFAPDSQEREEAEDLLSNIERLRAYASYFQTAAVDNALRKLAPQDMRQSAARFVRVMEPAARRSGIQVWLEQGSDTPLTTCPMHPSEVASVLFNFFSNSIKAIKRAGSQGRIRIAVGRAGGRIQLDFADNGDGIQPEHRGRIFNAFFTTNSVVGPFAEGHEELPSSGLGLKIVRDIAAGYGGTVSIIEPPQGFVTCFRFEVPALKAQ